MDKLTTTNAVTLPESFFLKEVTESYRQVIIDNLDDYFAGDNGCKRIIESMFNLQHKLTTDILALWCELCSNAFFEQNPNVDEVLCEVKGTNNLTLKEWAASR